MLLNHERFCGAITGPKPCLALQPQFGAGAVVSTADSCSEMAARLSGLWSLAAAAAGARIAARLRVAASLLGRDCGASETAVKPHSDP
jgi:hypothetical protein